MSGNLSLESGERLEEFGDSNFTLDNPQKALVTDESYFKVAATCIEEINKYCDMTSYLQKVVQILITFQSSVGSTFYYNNVHLLDCSCVESNDDLKAFKFDKPFDIYETRTLAFMNSLPSKQLPYGAHLFYEKKYHEWSWQIVYLIWNDFVYALGNDNFLRYVTKAKVVNHLDCSSEDFVAEVMRHSPSSPDVKKSTMTMVQQIQGFIKEYDLKKYLRPIVPVLVSPRTTLMNYQQERICKLCFEILSFVGKCSDKIQKLYWKVTCLRWQTLLLSKKETSPVPSALLQSLKDVTNIAFTSTGPYVDTKITLKKISENKPIPEFEQLFKTAQEKSKQKEKNIKVKLSPAALFKSSRSGDWNQFKTAPRKVNYEAYEEEEEEDEREYEEERARYIGFYQPVEEYKPSEQESSGVDVTQVSYGQSVENSDIPSFETLQDFDIIESQQTRSSQAQTDFQLLERDESIESNNNANPLPQFYVFPPEIEAEEDYGNDVGANEDLFDTDKFLS